MAEEMFDVGTEPEMLLWEGDMNTGGTNVVIGVLVRDLQNSTKTFLVGSKATDSKFFPTRTVTGPLFQSSGISSDLK